MALEDFGIQPLQNKPLDWLETAGRGIDPTVLAERSIPRPVAALGSFLNAFGNSRAAHRALGEKNAIETRLGVPLDFFNSLPNDAKQEILDKSGLGGDTGILNNPALGAGGVSLQRLSKLGGIGTSLYNAEHPKPETPLESLTRQMKEFEQQHQSEAYGTSHANAVQQGQIGSIQLGNLKRGRTESGGYPAGMEPKEFTAMEAAMIKAWLALPENAGKTVDEAVAATTFNKPGGLSEATGQFGETVYRKADGSFTADPAKAGPGAAVLLYYRSGPNAGKFYDPKTGQVSNGASISVTAPDGKTYTFPDQAAADRFKAEAGIP